MKLSKPTPEERQVALLWGVVTAASIVLRPLWLALAPLAPRCPFRALTGVPCPTCGTTHAAVALLHGHVGAALAANPLAAVAGIVFVVGGVSAPVWVALRGPIPQLPTPLPRWMRALMGAILLASWAYVVAASR